MIKEAIARLVKKEDLTAEQMNDVMEEIMTGEATDAQKAAFLTVYPVGYYTKVKHVVHLLFTIYYLQFTRRFLIYNSQSAGALSSARCS